MQQHLQTLHPPHGFFSRRILSLGHAGPEITRVRQAESRMTLVGPQ